MQNTPLLSPRPIGISEDEGDVANAVVAYFGESGSSHIRFAVDTRSNVRLLGIWREPEDDVSGTQMVTWLRDSGATTILVDEVAYSAIGFWQKLEAARVVDAWTDNRFKGTTVPIDVNALMDGRLVVPKRAPRPH